MQRIAYYLSPAYLFNLRPDPLGPTGKIWLPMLVGACLAAGIGLRVAAFRAADPIVQDCWRRVSNPLLVMGILGLLYAGIAWQGIPLLSTRILLLKWFVITGVWTLAVAVRERRRHPQRRAERERKLQYEKYLPK